MFEAGFTYILSKSLMNTRTKILVHKNGDFTFSTLYYSLFTFLYHPPPAVVPPPFCFAKKRVRFRITFALFCGTGKPEPYGKQIITTCQLRTANCYLLFAICYLLIASDCHLASAIWHLASGIWHLKKLQTQREPVIFYLIPKFSIT